MGITVFTTFCSEKYSKFVKKKNALCIDQEPYVIKQTAVN